MNRLPKGAKARLMGGLAVSAALLVPLAALGGPALARSTAAASEYQYSGSSSQYQYRVTICHRTGSKKHPFHSITVSSAAVRAHLKHGDQLGACTANPVASPQHGNSGEHGSGNGKGKGNGKGHGDG